MSATSSPFLDGLPVLKTARLNLRAPRESDFAAALAFNDSPRAAFLGGTVPRALVWRGLLAIIGHWALRGYGFYSVDTKDGAFIGRIGVIYHDGWAEPELAWHVFDGYEGMGFAHEAAVAARADYHARIAQRPLISYIRVENTRSAALARRLHAQEESQFSDQTGKIAIWRHLAPDRTAQVPA